MSARDVIAGLLSTPGPMNRATEADAILSALSAAGYALVPVVPTKEMVLAGETAQEDSVDYDRDSYGSYQDIRSDAYLAIWTAMLAAAAKEGEG